MTWHLIFRAEGDGPPAACRVRRLLKAALRHHGLRCIGYGPGEIPRQTPQDAPSADPTAGKASTRPRRTSGDANAPADAIACSGAERDREIEQLMKEKP